MTFAIISMPASSAVEIRPATQFQSRTRALRVARVRIFPTLVPYWCQFLGKTLGEVLQ
jgi:hypothetical protein